MPTLKPVGVMERVDREPVVVPIVAYRVAGDAEPEEVVQEIRFRPTMPMGQALDIMRATDEQGNVALPLAMQYLDACVMDEDRELFNEFLHRTDLIIDAAALVGEGGLYEQLTEYYAGRDRPTAQRSGSAGGRSNGRTTSRAAASSEASTSARSRSGKD